MITFPRLAVPPARSAPLLATSIKLGRRYFPAWGLSCSLAFHEIALVVMLLLTITQRPSEPFRPPQRAAPVRRPPVAVMMYFPPLKPRGGSVDKTNAPAGEKKTVSPAVSSPVSVPASPPARAARTDGLIYPGPQPILSDPPLPTNRIQNVSQPAFEDLPVLNPPVALPNMVLLADAAPPPQSAPPDPAAPQPDPVKPQEPLVKPPEIEVVSRPAELLPAEPQAPVLKDDLAPIVADPVLPLPAPRASQELMTVPPPALLPTAPKDVPKEAPKDPQPAPPAVLEEATEKPKVEPPGPEPEKPKQVPELEFSPESTRGPDARNFLALSPMPQVPKGPVQIPFGEARGRFAISPQPNLSTPETEPPSTLEKPSSAPPSSAPPSPTTTASIPAPASGIAGSPPKAVTVSFGAPAGAKAPSGTNGGTGAPVPGPRVQIASASANIRPGSPAVPGSGSGPGAGSSPFSGVTVVGGPAGTGAVPGTAPRPRPARPLQTSYGISVVSTESSGGGLPFSGVFASGQIHTVYLDMRQDATDTAPSWTLEFAVPRDSAAQANVAPQSSSSQQGLVLPFPAVKKQPVMPPEVVRRHPREMMIVYGVINTDGKMERVSVKKSPDPLLAGPVLEALSQWVFRPAILDGAPIPVEVLLGIPVWGAK